MRGTGAKSEIAASSFTEIASVLTAGAGVKIPRLLRRPQLRTSRKDGIFTHSRNHVSCKDGVGFLHIVIAVLRLG